VHGVHSAENVEEYDPAPQVEQPEEDELEYFPARQIIHVADEDAPKADEKVPAGHEEQVAEHDAPVVFEKVPTTHPEQLVDETENLPSSHRMQGPEPVIILYFPGIHVVHNPPPGPVKPMLH